MADAERDRTKIEAAPESTWGATEAAKAKWYDKYGKAAEKAAARDEKEKQD
jgi:hypothetical protein